MDIKKLIEKCNEAGFKETFYPNQNEHRAFWTKKLIARDMPYVNKHIVDDFYIFAEDEVIVEVTPHNMVQMVIIDRDYMNNEISFDSKEGRALLRDAGVKI